EKVARQRAAALEPTLPRLTIDVGRSSGVTEIRNDGAALDRSLWGTPIPVDPGSHSVEASGPGKRPWKGTVQVGASGAKATIAIPALEAEVVAGVPAADAAPAAAAPATVESSPAPDQRQSSSSIQKPLGLALGVAGVGGLVVGTIFALQYSSKNQKA